MWLLSKHSGFAQSESPIMETNDDKVLSYIKGLSLQADAPDLSWDANREDWVFKGTALTVREAIQHLAASGELESLANLHGISRDRLAECVAWLYNAHLVHCRNLSENLKNLSRDIELLTHKSSRSSLWGSSYLLREY
jgi:hypothetical protein